MVVMKSKLSKELFRFICLGILVLGCASKEPAEVIPECQVCVPNSVQCVGEFLATCNDTGTDQTTLSCLGGSKYCSDGQAPGCNDSICPSVGHRTCADESTVSACVAGAMENTACAAGEVCEAGTCAAASCTDGDTLCGYGAVLTCADGVFVSSACAAGEVCLVEEGAAGCTSRVCEPGTRTCRDADGDGVDELAQVCNLDGTGANAELEVNCADTLGVCVNGWCTCSTEAVSTEAEDTTGGEGLDLDAVSGLDISVAVTDVSIEQDLPPLEVPDTAEARINGSKISFDSYANANFVAPEPGAEGGMLAIILVSGVNKVELQIGPVPEGWTGALTESTGGAITGFMGYNDGTGGEGVDFKWGAGTFQKGGGIDYGGSYSVEVTVNEGPGGRVQGEFDGILQILQGQDGSSEVPVEDGTFDVIHN